MKQAIFLTIILVAALPLSSQTIWESEVPDTYTIDEEYAIEIQSWTDNAEWQAVNSKYNYIWQLQAIAEIMRLRQITNEKSNELLVQSYYQYKQSILNQLSAIRENVSISKMYGRQGFLEFNGSIHYLYRSKAISLLSLYYAIQQNQYLTGETDDSDEHSSGLAPNPYYNYVNNGRVQLIVGFPLTNGKYCFVTTFPNYEPEDITYRFGTADQVELEISAAPEDGKFNYIKKQIDENTTEARLTFTNHSYTYSIYQISGNEWITSSGISSIGIEVTDSQGNTTKLEGIPELTVGNLKRF